jgi:hypothetical protein
MQPSSRQDIAAPTLSPDLCDLRLHSARPRVVRDYMIAMSRRAVKSVPARVASRARSSSSDSTVVSGSPGAGALIPAVASSSASPSLWSHRQKCRTPANHPRAVLLEWLSRPRPASPDVSALQLDRPDLRIPLGEPVGQAAHRLLARPDGVVGVAVGPQRQLPGDVSTAKSGCLMPTVIGTWSAMLQSPWSHDGSICPAQQVGELGRVGHRLVPVAVV